MRRTVFALTLLAACAGAAVVYAQARSNDGRAPRADAPWTSAHAIVHGNHLLVLHDRMISVYQLEDLPRLTLVNAVELPSSMAAAREMMTKAKAAVPAAEEGRAVYTREHCADCHRINGSGGSVGPDLSHVGKTRSEEWIRNKITDPKASDPNSNMPAYQLPASQLDVLAGYLEGLT